MISHSNFKKNLWLALATLIAISLVAIQCGGIVTPAKQLLTEEPTAQPTIEELITDEPTPQAAQVEPEKMFTGVTLKAFFAPVGNQAVAYSDLIKQFEEETGATVEVITAPALPADNLTRQLQLLRKGSPEFDVYQVDVTWVGTLAEHAADLYRYIPRSEVGEHFPAIVENNIVDRQLIGLPWSAEVGVLYYRTDLLKKYGYTGPPQTWDELEKMALAIQLGERMTGKSDFWGFVWPTADNEEMISNALEWQFSHNGGRIIEPNRAITVNNSNTLTAFKRTAAWIGAISPPEVTTYQKAEAQAVWQSGNAAFIRGGSDTYADSNRDGSPIQGLFAATVLPTGAKNKAATLGGWQLIVSRYSKTPDIAAEFVRFMANRESQKFRAINGGYLPTIDQLYRDQEVLAAQPFLETLSDVFDSAVTRPATVTGEKYGEVSAAYANTIRPILTGTARAQDALVNLEKTLVDITGFEIGKPPETVVVANGSTLTNGGESNFLTRIYEGVTLKIFLEPVSNQAAAYADLIGQFERETGASVEVVTMTETATDNLAEPLQFLEAASTDLDIYQIDVTWPSILAEHAVDLAEYVPQREIDAHFPIIIQNNTVIGKLVGLPWFADAGVLYYRTDLLAKYGYADPPQTWAELEEMAAAIQRGERAEGNDRFWGFIWQGAKGEGLISNALEWQVAAGGGSIIEPNGQITVNNPEVVAAFKRAANWVGRISPPDVTNYREEDAWNVWRSGNAAFMRNWLDGYALRNSEDDLIRDKFEITVLPAEAGSRSAATLGGGQLMVSKYSDHVEAAALLVRYLTGWEAQRARAISGGYLPTMAALYTDAAVLDARPVIGNLSDVFTNAVARPATITGQRYREVSVAYATAVRTILTDQANAENILADLEQQLINLTAFEIGQP